MNERAQRGAHFSLCVYPIAKTNEQKLKGRGGEGDHRKQQNVDAFCLFLASPLPNNIREGGIPAFCLFAFASILKPLWEIEREANDLFLQPPPPTSFVKMRKMEMNKKRIYVARISCVCVISGAAPHTTHTRAVGDYPQKKYLVIEGWPPFFYAGQFFATLYFATVKGDALC